MARKTNVLGLYHIEIYRVSDKYDAPNICCHAAGCAAAVLKASLALAVDKEISPEVLQNVGLRGIISRVYEVTAHRDVSDPLRKAILNTIMLHPATRPIGSVKPGVLAAEIINLAKSFPDFRRDMFLKTVGCVGVDSVTGVGDPPVYLDFVEQVTCPNCQYTWGKDCKVISSRCLQSGVMNKWK